MFEKLLLWKVVMSRFLKIYLKVKSHSWFIDENLSRLRNLHPHKDNYRITRLNNLHYI